MTLLFRKLPPQPWTPSEATTLGRQSWTPGDYHAFEWRKLDNNPWIVCIPSEIMWFFLWPGLSYCPLVKGAHLQPLFAPVLGLAPSEPSCCPFISSFFPLSGPNKDYLGSNFLGSRKRLPRIGLENGPKRGLSRIEFQKKLVPYFAPFFTLLLPLRKILIWGNTVCIE